jgi:DNA-binding transcriptional LysR family regulator
MFGILRDAGIVPNVTQTVGEVPTLISLVHSRMGITITPLSVVKHSAASVVACNFPDFWTGITFEWAVIRSECSQWTI